MLSLPLGQALSRAPWIWPDGVTRANDCGADRGRDAIIPLYAGKSDYRRTNAGIKISSVSLSTDLR